MRKVLTGVVLAVLLAVSVVYAQTVSSSGQGPLIQCDSTAVVSIAGATTTDSIPLVANKKVFVCGYTLTVQGAAAANTVRFVTGTGTACGTGTTNLSGAMVGQAVAGSVLAVQSSVGFRGVASGSVCITTTTADAVAGHIHYAQF